MEKMISKELIEEFWEIHNHLLGNLAIVREDYRGVYTGPITDSNCKKFKELDLGCLYYHSEDVEKGLVQRYQLFPNGSLLELDLDKTDKMMNADIYDPFPFIILPNDTIENRLRNSAYLEGLKKELRQWDTIQHKISQLNDTISTYVDIPTSFSIYFRESVLFEGYGQNDPAYSFVEDMRSIYKDDGDIYIFLLKALVSYSKIVTAQKMIIEHHIDKAKTRLINAPWSRFTEQLQIKHKRCYDALQIAIQAGEVERLDNGRFNFIRHNQSYIHLFFVKGGYTDWEIIREYIFSKGKSLKPSVGTVCIDTIAKKSKEDISILYSKINAS